jgi:hypothetical protein
LRHSLSDPGGEPPPYLDFDLRLEPYQEGLGFPVTVIHSPAGEGRGALDLGGGPDVLAALRREFLQLVGDREEIPDLPPLRRASRELRQRAQDLGGRLFDALFQGEVRRLYDRSWGMARPARGLRLRLHLEPRHPQLQALCSLPWEILYSKADQSFLCLDPSTPVVRHLDLPVPPRAAALRRPLTILVALSSPRGCPELSVTRERARLEQAWFLRDEVNLVVLEKATLPAVREAVRRRPVHAFHFIGHAAFDPGSGEGVLLFESRGGGPEAVGGRELAQVLHGIRMPQVAFLNACHTARHGEGERTDPMGGAAVSLLANDVPAVVAMQARVADETAITFGAAFYGALARGGALEDAVTEGRNQVFTSFPRSLDWATPVLFLRAPHGDLFQLEKARPTAWLAEPGREAPRAAAGTKVLATFQKDIYRLFDDIGLGDMPAYRRLRSEERRIVQHEVIRRMAGLGVQPQDLLDIRHLNARFSASDLLRDQGVRSGRGELQRKSALFSSHSLATIPGEWTLAETDEDERVRGTFDESTLQLLLDHRPLVEAGKMCVVPRLIYQQVEYEPRCLFAVKDLATVGVNLRDDWARSALTQQGKMFQAAVVLDVSAGGLLPLADVLEVEERYQVEYDHFQVHLRRTLDRMHQGGEDFTDALRRTLEEVDEGIRRLEDRYQAILRKRRDTAGRIGAGGLAILLYGLGAAELAFLVSAFSSAALSEGIRLVRQLEEIPAEVRASPLFVPWLIQRRGGS